MFPNKLHFSLVLVLRLSTIFTDVFTFFHIKLSSRQCSTSDSVCNICHTRCNEQNNLQVQQNMNDQTISPIQNGVTTSPTACSGSQGAVAQLDDTGRGMSGNIPHPEGCLWTNNNNCCCNKQKLDIPFKSTFFSNLVIAYFFISFFLQNFVLTYSDVLLILFFLTLNIPLIVCWSRKNNFENMAAARQRNNSNAWNWNQNSEHHRHYQIMLAREQRNQAHEMSAAESFQHLHTNPVLFVTEPTPVL
jgi:hypothetical protein